jgi:hypothetical protein
MFLEKHYLVGTFDGNSEGAIDENIDGNYDGC